MLRAVTEALEDDAMSGAVDVGGPDVIAYPDLMRACSRGAGPDPASGVPALVAPDRRWSALATALVTTAPFHTVTSLIESLRHDMVCRPDRTWVPRERRSAARGRGGRAPGVRSAATADPEAALASDPTWTRPHALPGRRTAPRRRPGPSPGSRLHRRRPAPAMI